MRLRHRGGLAAWIHPWPRVPNTEERESNTSHTWVQIAAAFLLLGILCMSDSFAQDSSSLAPQPTSGLFFTGGFVQGGTGEGGGIQPWLGVGWRFGGKWSTAVHFQTGHLEVGAAAGRPVDGNLFFGGALLEVQFEGSSEGIHPIGGIAGGLATALNHDGVGYNGAQAGLMAGGAWNFHRMFRASLSAELMHRWWINGVGDAAQGMNPFSVSSIGISLELAFFPGINL